MHFIGETSWNALATVSRSAHGIANGLAAFSLTLLFAYYNDPKDHPIFDHLTTLFAVGLVTSLVTAAIERYADEQAKPAARLPAAA